MALREKIEVSYDKAFGSGKFYSEFEGLVNNIERRYKETQSDYMKEEYEQFMANVPCPDCHGARLKPEVLGVTVGGLSIAEHIRFACFRDQAFHRSFGADGARRNDSGPYSQRN